MSFPEAQREYFELQPKVKKVTYAQAAASQQPTYEIAILTHGLTTMSDTAGLIIFFLNQQWYLKLLRTTDHKKKLTPHKQCPCDPSCGPMGGRREGLSHELYHEGFYVDTSGCTTDP
jgi:hypothetical protein